MMARQPAPLAVESARALAACMTDTADRALVLQLIRTRTEGGRMPSLRILPPLARVTARILAGDGTDDTAEFWRSQATAAQQHQRALTNRAHVRKTYRKRYPDTARAIEDELNCIVPSLTP